LLAWEPVFADIALSGDLGYTTGPWEFREHGDGPSAFGEFVTIWNKQSSGEWRVVIDIGVRHAAPGTVTKRTLSTPVAGSRPGKARNKPNLVEERAELLATDRELANAVSEKGNAQGYLNFLSDEVRLFRTNSLPILGKREAFAALSQQSGRAVLQPAKAEVSRIADLGYTVGTSKFGDATKAKDVSSNYVHIWKRQGSHWKLVLDVESPLQPPGFKNP
jgi:ketosteroid isomerase-like protein